VFGGGPRRYGRGKENIPPKKDEEQNPGSDGQPQAQNARKRLRVTRRDRSGSVVSVRSESSSASRPSIGLSRTASLSRFPSPTPSTATSFESVASLDPLDVMEEDVERTPTKRKASTSMSASTSTSTLGRAAYPTPPLSSPLQGDADVDATTERIELIRMQSDQGEKEEAKNPYKHLKSFLRLSSSTTSSGAKGTADECVIGREDEKAVLRSYLSLRSVADVGLYVSGPPGTGKTALVTAMGRDLEVEGWRVILVGCMGLKVADMWPRLAEQLHCSPTEEDVLSALIRRDTLIILDEIDSLLPPSPCLPPPATSHLLSKIFSLPLLSDETSIKLVSISNTLDLTVRARLSLPNGAQPQVLPFKAYVAGDMVSIVNSRIEAASRGRAEDETVKVDSKAVELLTRKVEAQNGDLRMCLGCLTGAVNLAETEWVKKTLAPSQPNASAPLIKVSLPHTLKAFNSHTQQLKAAAGSTTTASTSPTGRKIRSVPLQGKMVLVSILIFLTRVRAGLPGCPSVGGTATPPKQADVLTTSSLYAAYAHLLSHHTSPFPPAAESDYRDLLSNLETLGLVSIGGNGASMSMSRSTSGRKAGSAAGGPKVELCVREDEVREGLGLLHAGGKGLADEEVAKVWEREEGRAQKAKDKAAKAAQAQVESESI
jgi:cell division control protein 6